MDLELAKKLIVECDAFDSFDEFEKGYLLLKGVSKTFSEKETVFKKGERAAPEFFLVAVGTMEMRMETTHEVEKRLGPGALMGEVGIINPTSERTRSVMAGESTEVILWRLADLDPGFVEKLKTAFEKIAFERIAGDLP